MERSGDVVSRVRKWLTEEGYPLELSTGRQLEGEWDVRYQPTFKDPETQKVRTADLEAWRRSESDEGNVTRVSLWIECKASADKPWVVFAERAGQYLGGPMAEATLLGRGPVAAIAFDEMDLLAKVSATFRPTEGERLGFSVVRAFKDSRQNARDQAFDATRSVIAGATACAYVSSDAWMDEEGFGPDGRLLVDIQIPVLVLEGVLLSCELLEAGELDIQKADHLHVRVPDVPRGGGPALVHLVTADGLADFVADLREDTDHVLRAGIAQLDSAIPRIRSRLREFAGRGQPSN